MTSGPRHRDLVFTSAGDNSNLAEWLEGERAFDLCVAYYGEQGERYRELADYWFAAKDSKFPNLLRFHRRHPGLLAGYESVMVTDDDVILSAADINEVLRIRRQLDLWLCQPAVSDLGRVSHREITMKRPLSRLRYTNFVEMGCPVFRTDKLLAFLSIFSPILKGHGTDWLYMHSLGPSLEGRVAVIDSVSLINPHVYHKPSGRREIQAYLGASHRAGRWQELKAELGIEPEAAGKVIYRTVRRQGVDLLGAAVRFAIDYWTYGSRARRLFEKLAERHRFTPTQLIRNASLAWSRRNRRGAVKVLDPRRIRRLPIETVLQVSGRWCRADGPATRIDDAAQALLRSFLRDGWRDGSPSTIALHDDGSVTVADGNRRLLPALLAGIATLPVRFHYVETSRQDWRARLSGRHLRPKHWQLTAASGCFPRDTCGQCAACRETVPELRADHLDDTVRRLLASIPGEAGIVSA